MSSKHECCDTDQLIVNEVSPVASRLSHCVHFGHKFPKFEGMLLQTYNSAK